MTTASAQRTWQHARPAFRWAPLGLAAVLLVGCGGGDDDDTSPPPSAGAFTVGGSVTGLGAGKTLTLQNSAADDLSVNANGSFVFVTRLDSGVAYAVTVKTQPNGQRCTVTQGTGAATANVSDVQVRCENLAAATFTVGGSVSGLAGTAVLQNNGGDDLSVASNGGFTFASALAGGAAYAVTVRSQPAGQNCTVRNGTGTVASANVASVEVSCATAAAGWPEGDWKQEACNSAGTGQWARSLWRLTRQAENRASVRQGVVVFRDANCTGPGTPREDLMFDVGQFVFDRRDSTSTLTAYWGSWELPSGRVTRTIWAQKDGRFCLLGGEDNLGLPTAVQVERYVDLVIPSKTCYSRN
jgi:hypothetical protein